nr:haloacid dehalogenase-like hydrolase [Maliibacterium massiliense]
MTTHIRVFDFDKTIFLHDSTVDFYLYCLLRRPYIALLLPYQLWGMLCYLLKRCDKTTMKQRFFSFLRFIGNGEKLLEGFWREKAHLIAKWYRALPAHDRDVVISASPHFLVEGLLRPYGVRAVIASEVDKATGRFVSPNCYGKQKVVRLSDAFPDACVEAFYSDSLSDAPLAALAQHAYLVKGETLETWPQ